ncbi:hypothetical protein R6Q57_008346 [Mikania cordata]
MKGLIGNPSGKWTSGVASPRRHPSSVGTVMPDKFLVRYHKPAPSEPSFSRLTTTMTSDLYSEFIQVYDILKYDLVHDPLFDFDDNYRQMVEQLIDYNVLGGKMVRGFSVVDTYQILKGELTNDEVFLTSALGWCNEWVGMAAIIDGVLLRNHTHRIINKYFKEKPYYVNLLDLFNQAELLTSCGQMIDVREKDLSKYSMSLNHRIIQYKSGYYSLYLPVSCALLMFGEYEPDDDLLKEALVEMGIYYQVQNDYLDTFGDPNVYGKTGTDIEEFKCSWLIAKALELANKEQMKILVENYGSTDQANVDKVKELYHTLNLQGAYEDYEEQTHAKLTKLIDSHPKKAIQAVLNSCLGKIFKGHK